MLSNRRASIFAVLIAAGLLAAVAAWLLPPTVKARAPDAQFNLLDGREIALAQLRGRPVLVVFWATNCAPCVEELPRLIALYREFAPRNFELIAVAMPYDPPFQVYSFSREHGIPYPVATDLGGRVTQAFGGVEFIPLAYLIDPMGRIVYRRTGKLDSDRLRRLIEGQLASVRARP